MKSTTLSPATLCNSVVKRVRALATDSFLAECTKTARDHGAIGNKTTIIGITTEMLERAGQRTVIQSLLDSRAPHSISAMARAGFFSDTLTKAIEACRSVFDNPAYDDVQNMSPDVLVQFSSRSRNNSYTLGPALQAQLCIAHVLHQKTQGFGLGLAPQENTQEPSIEQIFADNNLDLTVFKRAMRSDAFRAAVAKVITSEAT